METELYEDLTFVDELARKYTGQEFSNRTPGEKRYKMVFVAERWTGQ